ncbi:MAG: redox-regulated ATPase YchF [Planctomycetes bacterium]|nr:redox-regulated ATPase YchF [Planctomycetota bacterium]
MRIALVGRAGSGKTTLFNALGGSREKVPGTLQDERKVLSVEVPDPRLDWLAEIYKPKKYTPTRIEFVDFPGIPKSEEKGLSEVLAAVRDTDGLAYVVRAFNSDEYAYEDPTPDAVAEYRSLSEDLQFHDYAILSKRIEKLEVTSKKPHKNQDLEKRELALLAKIQDQIENHGVALRDIELHADEELMLRGFRFCSQKPVLALVNVAAPDAIDDGMATRLGLRTEQVMQFVASIEEEIASLDPEDQAIFLAEYGIEHPVRERIIQTAYDAIGLCSFLTAGEDEVRAWTISKGEKAVEAAGKIHSDIQRGFIRAEVVAFEDLKKAGDFRAAKAQNLVRLEPKDYIVKDGDVINFRFSV